MQYYAAYSLVNNQLLKCLHYTYRINALNTYEVKMTLTNNNKCSSRNCI